MLPTIEADLEVPKSEIRFGYGLLYEYVGKVLHGLNRYNVMIGLKIPDFRLPNYYIPDEIDPNYCEKYRDNNGYRTLYRTCENIWPAYLASLEKVKRHQKDIQRIMTKDLPVVIPQFDPNDLGTDPVEELEVNEEGQYFHQRIKRFITDLIGLGIQGISAFLQHRKQSKLEKGMKLLMNNQKRMGNRIQAIEGDMMSLTEATVDELEYLRKELHSQGLEIRHIVRQVKTMDHVISKQSERIDDNSNAVIFLSGVMYAMMAKMERYLSLYEQVHSELDHLLDALKSLEKGELSQSVILPSVLDRVVTHIKEQLDSKYPEYELVLTETHFYYNMPFVSATYQKGVIGVQIPFFIKPKLQETLDVFQLRSVPVPFHMNPEMIDETESEYAYTQLVPSTELLGMSSDTYINLKRGELERCYKVGIVHFCEHLMLMKHHSEHTCESAIYHHQGADLIKEKCNIRYFPTLDPEPELLDAGNHFLLAHLPSPWTVQCLHTDQIPGTIEGSNYVIIKKSDLCGCTMQAGKFFIQGNIKHCGENIDAEVDLYYTVNMMTMIYEFKEKVDAAQMTDISLYLKPMPLDPEEPNIVIETEEDVLDRRTPPSVAFSSVYNRQQKRLWATKEDKAMGMNDPENWFSSGNQWFGFLGICALLTILLLIIAIPHILKTLGLATKLSDLSTLIGKIHIDKVGKRLGAIITGSQVTSLPTVSNALRVCDVKASTQKEADNQDDFISIHISTFSQFLVYGFKFFALVLVLYGIYKFFKLIYQYNTMHNIAAIQAPTTWYRYLLSDQTKVYVQVVSNNFTCAILLGNYFGNPEDILTEGVLLVNQVNLIKGILKDHLVIDWSNFYLSMSGVDLQLPTHFPIPWYYRLPFRLMVRKDWKYRLIACNQAMGKVKVLCEFVNMKISFMSLSEELDPEDPVEESLSSQSACESASPTKPPRLRASPSTVCKMDSPRPTLKELYKWQDEQNEKEKDFVTMETPEEIDSLVATAKHCNKTKSV